MPFFLIFFIFTPLLEMWLLIEVGSRYGAAVTIAAVLMTALLGLLLLRKQGVVTLMRASQRLQQGELPALELVEGLLLAIGGVLLLAPGFATDTLGFSCLLPWTRRVWAQYLLPRLRAHYGGDAGVRGEVIDGECRHEEPSPVRALSEERDRDRRL